jgi:hypothetical protein
MEVPQGNSMCSYLKEAKMSLFFFYKLKNRKVEQVLPGWFGTSGSERRWRKGIGG